MNIHLTKSQIGLDGVPAAETVLSHVDGERGELIIAGEHVGRLAADPSASHAADTLRMLHGRPPAAREVTALDAYLVTASDHGMNASTFTARVVASTQADLFAAVTAGYCALTGPLHGGAPEPVLEMLDAIGSRERIQTWVDAALARGERLMGFGHRVYRVRDPRADVLKTAIEALAADGACARAAANRAADPAEFVVCGGDAEGVGNAGRREAYASRTTVFR